jgi:putative hydrolase of the HAD superfamily
MDEATISGDQAVRALLFDLGGVVIDFDFERAFRFWADRASCDPGVLGKRFSLDVAYEQHERGEILASDYFAALRQSLDVSISDDDFIAGWNDVYIGPVPGMAALLSIAKERFPLFAFTNSNPTHQRVWTMHYANELLPFRSIFVSSELGLRKPDPEAFCVVARRIGFQPDEIMFFDDTPGNIDGASKAGMQGVLVESISDVRQALSRLGLEVEAANQVDI